MNTLPAKAMLALALVAAAPASSWADLLYPSADSMINPAYPSTNFGSLPELSISGSSAMLLQFDMSYIPTNYTVQSARLTFFVNKALVAGTLHIGLASTSWTESGVTYATAPVATSPGVTVAVSASSTFVSVDVGSLVVAQLANGNYGFVISADVSAPTTSVVIDSKESTTTAHPAFLQIAYSAPSTPLLITAGNTGSVACTVNTPCATSYTLDATCPAGYLIIGLPQCQKPTSIGFGATPLKGAYTDNTGSCQYSGTINAQVTERLSIQIACGIVSGPPFVL
jgi:hypothetical protein